MRYPPLHLLINPAAGRGRAGKRLAAILTHFQAAGLKPTVHLSNGPGDIEAEARALSHGNVTLLIAGGDGSVHELANGLLAAQSEVPFGVIPVGTGNDFAKAAEIPLDWETATRLLAERIASDSPPRRVDAGCMNGRYFANGAGIGFDATVTRIVRGYRRPVGDIVYLFAILRAMADGIETPTLRIASDGDELWHGPLTIANAAIGPWIGGMFHIAPMADHADGEMNLVVAGPVKRRRILRLLPKLAQGTHIEEPEIRHWSVTALTVDADVPVASHLDGEVQELATHFEIEILPGSLHLI